MQCLRPKIPRFRSTYHFYKLVLLFLSILLFNKIPLHSIYYWPKFQYRLHHHALKAFLFHASYHHANVLYKQNHQLTKTFLIHFSNHLSNFLHMQIHRSKCKLQSLLSYPIYSLAPYTLQYLTQTKYQFSLSLHFKPLISQVEVIINKVTNLNTLNNHLRQFEFCLINQYLIAKVIVIVLEIDQSPQNLRVQSQFGKVDLGQGLIEINE